MEGLDFSVPGYDKKAGRSPSRLLFILILFVLIAFLANTAILLLFHRNDKILSQDTALSPEKQKQLALKLENQGLNNAAVDAWKEYLSASPLAAEETARIWYRIGKIYMEENQYDMALSAFYRSESFGTLDDISSEIARLTQECLESMGRFAALRYELSDRAGSPGADADDEAGGTADPVVAEIGPEKITKSDLDRRIEYLIETQLSQFAGYLPGDQINKQKEELLKQYSTDSQRKVFLSQYIGEELLYRNAIKQGLTDSPEVRSQLKDMERSFLAAKLIEDRYRSDIKITQVDLENYFQANKEKYVRPERVKIGHILVKNEYKAREVRKRLANGEDFDSLASELSMDEETRERGGELSNWIEKGETNNIAGITIPDTAMDAIFSLEKGNIVDEDIKSDKGFHILKILEKEGARQLDFNEVRERVALELRSRKETEVREDLLEKLRQEYDVVIHNSAFFGNTQEIRE